jgi:dihydroorotate dehydrogenase (NAD+) catalytic subunit
MQLLPGVRNRTWRRHGSTWRVVSRQGNTSLSIAYPAPTAVPPVPPPLATPVYRFDRTFEQNATEGPAFAGLYPDVPVTPMKDFFGHRVASRIGIAASLLVNERWFELYSRLGFDLLTYKTIRSRRRLAHPLPNWLYLNERTVLAGGPATPLETVDGIPAAPVGATAAGSIGMPSSSPEVWRQDIRRCRARLRPGQIMIVSVVGTADADTTEAQIVDDFSALAVEARDAGAQVVELNFSCPNVGQRENEVYRDTSIASRIAVAARTAVGSLPLLVKIGPIEERDRMAELLRGLSGLADGVVMINAPSRIIANASGAPAFGAKRERAGMMGGAVFDIAMKCVRTAVEIIRNDGLDLHVLAVGGVCSAERISAFADAGAYAVLGASACAWDPFLAIRAKHRDPML